MALPTLDAVFASAADQPRRLMLSQWLVNELFQTSDYTNASYSNSQALANYYTLPEQYLWAKIAVAVGAPRSESDYISLPKNYVWKDIYDAVSGSSNGTIDWGEKQAVGHIAAAYRGDAGVPANLATYIDWPWRYQVAAISVTTKRDLPTFIRDFAGLKTLNHGVGPTINFTRDTNATYFDSNGILRFAPHNVLRNSQAAGSTAGVIGSGGVLPTFWAGGSPSDAGISAEVTAGSEGGFAFLDLKVSGTASGAGFVNIHPNGFFDTVATSGQTWTLSSYLNRQAGSTANATVKLYIEETTASASLSPQVFSESDITSSLTATRARFSLTRTVTNAATTRISPLIQVAHGVGAIDITLRIAAPQLERNNSASEYIPTTGVAKYDQPRFDHGPLTITVSGLSDTQYNGEYTYSGEVTGYPYYLKAGVAEIGAGQGVASGIWRLEDLNTGDHFIVDGFENEAAFPWLVAAWENQGINPAGVTISQPNDNSKGLLIEESRTNLLERSAELNNAYWNKLNATVTANDTVAPDGTATADAVFETVDDGFHAVSRGAVVPSTGTVTMSVFAKANGRSRFGIQVGAIYGDFDLSAVTASVPFGGISASIEPISNGWYRCAFTIAATADDAYILVFLDGASNSYAGDTTKGMYFWGAQAELGAFATSYIPTTGGTATRAVDSAIVTPISPFYNQSEGTLFAEFVPRTRTLDNTFPRTAVSFDNDSGANYVGIGVGNGTNGTADSVAWVGVTTSLQWDVNGGSSVVGANMRVAGAYAANDAQAAINGSLGTADTSLTLGTLTHMRVGSRFTADRGSMAGHIRKIAYWPKRLTNTLLQDITT